MACPPSARLESGIEECSSEFAQQGTDAHELAAYKVLRLLGQELMDPRPRLTFYDEEMEKATDAYAELVNELFTDMCRDGAQTVVFIEQRVDLGDYVPESFGTSDCILVRDGRLVIVDFKYGTGIRVEAKGNPQLKIYALGALSMLEQLFSVDTVDMYIVQPRLDHIGVMESTPQELHGWAESELIPKAVMAFNGEGDFSCGEHCRFCKAKSTCRERAAVGLELARREFSAQLTDEEIEGLLPRLDGLVSWAEDLKAYALDQALKGHRWNGYKIVEGRSVRKFTDEDLVAKAVEAAGKDPYERKLRSLTSIEKLLGKQKFNDMLGGLISKTQGKPTLVPDSDPRQEYSPVESEFKND